LEQALNVQRVLDPDDREKVCDLLLALGDALTAAGEPQRAINTELQEAFSLAEAIGDKIRAASACSLAMIGLISYGAGHGSWSTPEAARWVERADRYASPETPARIMANKGVGELKALTGFDTRRFDMANEGCQLLIQNVELARRLNDPEVFRTAACSLIHASAPQNARMRLKVVEELARQPLAGMSARTRGTGMFFIAGTLLESGQRRRVEELSCELKETMERTGQANLRLMWMSLVCVLATLDGRLEDAAATGQDILTQGEQLGLSKYANVAGFMFSSMALVHLGRLDDIPRLFKACPLLASPQNRAFLGQDEEAERILEQWVVARQGIGSTNDETPAYVDMLLLQAALRVKQRPAVELLMRRFADCDMRTTGGFFPTCIARHLGAAAAFLGRHEEARTYFDQALKVCSELPFRPELALTRLQLAELLLEHYPNERADALDHLDFAIKEFREMKMQPSLDRALKYRP
jgi:tetratricopeptide (TPR) repeat protein